MQTTLSLGTAQFGLNYGITNTSGVVSSSEVASILDLAHDLGIYQLDTAPRYGNCESILGSFNQDRFQVTTKIDCAQSKSQHEFDRCIEVSRSRLNVSKLRLLIHDAEFASMADLKATVRSAINNEYIEEIGASIYSPERAKLISGLEGVEFIQLPFNILSRRLIESQCLDFLKNSGLKIEARSIFLQGILLSDNSVYPSVFGRIEKSILESWRRYTVGLEKLDLCLAHVKRYSKYFDRIIIGVTCQEELSQIADSWKTNHSSTRLPVFGVTEKTLLDTPYLW